MKTSALIIATFVTGANLVCSSAIENQGEIDGKLNLKPTVKVSEKIKVSKDASVHLDNFTMKNSQVWWLSYRQIVQQGK